MPTVYGRPYSEICLTLENLKDKHLVNSIWRVLIVEDHFEESVSKQKVSVRNTNPVQWYKWCHSEILHPRPFHSQLLDLYPVPFPITVNHATPPVHLTHPVNTF
ncbi:hypothetical protein ACJMK2_036935 [Sinanodonta woodiana]|uniref:Uncharacterized protein n=1 Tax=Sinanodonta woodiana TaxID=1069815 RepID=A0ABD3WKJ4_SINWO